jgi:hypothetical protein
MKPFCRFIPPFTGVCTPLADEVWTAYSASSHVTPLIGVTSECFVQIRRWKFRGAILVCSLVTT